MSLAATARTRAGTGTTRRGAPAVLRVLPAPTTDPRAEGPDWGDRTHPVRSPYVQDSLAVDLWEDGDSFFGPQTTPTADLPDAVPWARRMIQAMLEAYDGTRSAQQLARWVSSEIRDRAHRRGLLARRRGLRPARPPVVRSVHASFPADGVCEIAAVVWTEGRIRALALRMTGVDGRWLITDWELG